MSTTLARRIRRIGALPTTYREVKEESLSHNDQGEETIVVKTKKIPVRHFSCMTNEDREARTAAIRSEAEARRLVAKMAVKVAQNAAQAKRLAAPVMAKKSGK